MKRYRKTQIYIICALLVVIAGLGIGFAAFSSTLNISSSASVTPDSSTFSIGFYSENTTTLASGQLSFISSTSTGGASGSSITIDDGETSISGLNANFTAPGETVTYSFYVGNSGEYDAYLRTINFNNITGASSNKVCTAGTGATDSLVQAACNDISISVNVHGITEKSTNSNISSKKLYKKTYEPITITIEYASNGNRADGPFTVSFGDISLDYSTVDGAKLINFSVGKYQCIALEGMTWEEYLNSEYVHPELIGEHLCNRDDLPLSNNEVLVNHGMYTYGCPT